MSNASFWEKISVFILSGVIVYTSHKFIETYEVPFVFAFGIYCILMILFTLVFSSLFKRGGESKE